MSDVVTSAGAEACNTAVFIETSDAAMDGICDDEGETELAMDLATFEGEGIEAVSLLNTHTVLAVAFLIAFVPLFRSAIAAS